MTGKPKRSRGRPKVYHGERVTSQFRCDTDINDQWTEAAAERGVSKNAFLQRALAHYLNTLVPLDELLPVYQDQEAS